MFFNIISITFGQGNQYVQKIYDVGYLRFGFAVVKETRNRHGKHIAIECVAIYAALSDVAGLE